MPPTPRKNAGSKTSLADLLGKDNKNEEVSGDTTDVDRNVNSGIDGTDVEQPGSEVVKDEKPVEQNPDGITFSGRENVINKTPADLASESPQETADRYGISDEIPQSVVDNPNIQRYADETNFQVPGGTHLHPDVARDNYNRNVGGAGNSVTTTRVVTENVYATEAEVDDKGRKNPFADVAGDDEPENEWAEPYVAPTDDDAEVKG